MNIRYKKAHYFTLSHPLLGSSVTNYIKILFRNKFRIDPRFSLKFIFSFATALFWSPLRWLERLLLFKKIKETEVKSPIIILGHPRSGTTYLHYLLAEDPKMAYSNTYQVFMPHIFYFFGKYIGKMMDPMMPKKRAMDNLSMGAFKPTMDEFALANIDDASWCHGFYFPKNIKRYFDRYVSFADGDEKAKKRYKKSQLWFARKMQLRYPNQRLIIKSAATSARIKELLEIFPKAQFLHIYRNPYDTYLSTERLYEKILPMFGFHKVNNDFIEDYIIESYKAYHQKWFSEKALIPKEQLFEFAFEDFTINPLPLLLKAYRQFNITPDKEVIAGFEKIIKAHSAYQKNSYQNVPDDLKLKIGQQWKFCFEEWGYAI